KYSRMATIADDFAYGHEMCAGFQQVFEDAGGRIVQKLWPPLNTPDYGAYIALAQNQSRRHLPWVRRLQWLQVPQAISRIRPEKSFARGNDRDRRVAVATNGRRRA